MKYYHIPGTKKKMTWAERCSFNERFYWEQLGCFQPQAQYDGKSFYEAKIVEPIKKRAEVTGRRYSPHESLWLKPFELCPFNRTKVVFLVPNPYRIAEANDGLCISVPPHYEGRRPTALSHLLTEYERDLGYGQPKTTSLHHWARQGVLMLNMRATIDDDLSLDDRDARHYEGVQWKGLIREVLCQLSDKRNHVVFVLFGRATAEWAKKIIFDQDRHLIITANWTPHGNLSGGQLRNKKFFSRANKFLVDHKMAPINWRLPSHGKNQSRLNKIFGTSTSEKGKAWQAFQAYKTQRTRGKVVI